MLGLQDDGEVSKSLVEKTLLLPTIYNRYCNLQFIDNNSYNVRNILITATYPLASTKVCLMFCKINLFPTA